MWAIVLAIAAIFASSAASTSCSIAVRFSSSFLTVSGQLVASNLLKVSVLSEVGGGTFSPFSWASAWRVPVEKVVGEHAYGVIFRCGIIGAFRFGNPAGLLGSEARNGSVDGDEPLGFVVRRAELGEQDGFQRGRRSGGLGCLCNGERREEEGKEDWFDGHDRFPFVAMECRCAMV